MNRYLRVLITLPLFAAFLAALPGQRLAARPDEEKAEKKAPRVDLDPVKLMTVEERALFDALNAFRREAITKGNVPLVPDAGLIKGSRAQATAMARKATVNEAAGRENFNRVVGAAFAKERIVKIMGWTEGFATPERVIEVFLKDPKNRDQLIHPGFRAAGVGIIRTDRNEFYYTLTLLAPE